MTKRVLLLGSLVLSRRVEKVAVVDDDHIGDPAPLLGKLVHLGLQPVDRSAPLRKVGNAPNHEVLSEDLILAARERQLLRVDVAPPNVLEQRIREPSFIPILGLCAPALQREVKHPPP